MTTPTSSENYRFFVKPLNSDANEQIAARLNQLCESAYSAEVQTIVVKGKTVTGVYQVPHSFLTELSHSVHKNNVRYYVQEGDGEIRLYSFFNKRLRTISRTKEASSMLKKLKKLQ